MNLKLTTIGAALALSLASLAPAMAADQPGAGKTIKMAQATWDTGWFQAEIYKQMFEDLGYDVSGPMTLDAAAFYQAVSQGDVDLWVNGWFPLHETYKPTFEGYAEVDGAVAVGGALQGYLVDKAAIDEFGIKTLDDFKRPEVKKAFDRDGDGRADLVACPPGWGCEVTITDTLNDFDLNDDIEAIKAGYSASMADAIAAYQNGEHILFYTWTPNWTVNELQPGKDVMWIEVPQKDGVDMPAPAEGLDTCVADPCSMGFVANDIVPVINTKFKEANPAIDALLQAASIPLQDIFAQNAAMNNGDDDVKAQATAWIKAHQEQVDGWLDAARAAAN
ncbi:glycine betaine/L-proline ABC transporter substrate-binding protein ProX [Martelella alba]|uniref:Glycine betaine/L-proline ABC transporter substrate-binding protein ProX n=1 Tax=Martelella alba TaxID=2590451 RepID=A0A506UIG8_9HYPH|nr:glycine betaine/L-proline ABC transporter substrate-binding protein ProX [Martelella alba]TPW33106.1 glycine betaine/L-proline ABC transporter substrate-binding protein ProX [Martelella alba]